MLLLLLTLEGRLIRRCAVQGSFFLDRGLTCENVGTALSTVVWLRAQCWGEAEACGLLALRHLLVWIRTQGSPVVTGKRPVTIRSPTVNGLNEMFAAVSRASQCLVPRWWTRLRRPRRCGLIGSLLLEVGLESLKTQPFLVCSLSLVPAVVMGALFLVQSSYLLPPVSTLPAQTQTICPSKHFLL